MFVRMRFDPERAEAYGFIKKDWGYEFGAEFLDGDFGAVLTVDADGNVTGSVNDRMNDEEFGPLRNPFYNGAYVNTVRAAYEDLLRDIAEHCFTDKSQGVLNEDLIHKVLDIADRVPYGKVATYGQIAALAGMEKKARLVGKIMSMADRYGEHPCHRVVNAAGRTVPGWNEQRPMLETEGIVFKANGCVDMKRCQWEKQK